MSSKVIRVGDTVRFSFGGNTTVTGKVTEDRGPIGVGGRRLYQITYYLGKDNRYIVEMPACEFEVVEPKDKPA
jgi:hypothetical protein